MSPVATGAADPLAGLRDYHLPEAVSWWPPAPGWWLLFVLSLVAALAIVWWLGRRRRRLAVARTAARELARLRTGAAGQGGAALARELSKLLRRYACAVYPREPVAGLSGEAWLAFLDAHGGDGRFASGPGRVLIEAPYRPVGAAGEALVELVADWIRHNREVRR